MILLLKEILPPIGDRLPLRSTRGNKAASASPGHLHTSSTNLEDGKPLEKASAYVASKSRRSKISVFHHCITVLRAPAGSLRAG